MDDKPTRYFIISYLFGNKELGTGVIGCVGTKYPNIHNLKKDSKIVNFNPITITELSEEDYTEFWKKESE